jgi:hypothetical protein
MEADVLKWMMHLIQRRKSELGIHLIYSIFLLHAKSRAIKYRLQK